MARASAAAVCIEMHAKQCERPHAPQLVATPLKSSSVTVTSIGHTPAACIKPLASARTMNTANKAQHVKSVRCIMTCERLAMVQRMDMIE